jgi:predicted deacylase
MTDVTRRTADFAGLDVPVIEVSSDAPGPRLSVISGVHGCEYASIAGVRRWVSGLAEDPERLLRGSVTVVPVVNVPAFWARTPFVVPEDGKNLNRCFPGSPDGTLAERLAFAVFGQVITGSDAVVDVHAGDLVEALEPFVMYDGGPAEDFARGLADAYGIRYVVRQAPGPDQTVAGSSSAAAAAAGIPAITAEAGDGARARARRRAPLPGDVPGRAGADGPCLPERLHLAAHAGRGLVGACRADR